MYTKPFGLLLGTLGILLVASFLGNSIFDSDRAINPENVLTDDLNYAQLQFGDENMSCPSGFIKHRSLCSDHNTQIVIPGMDINRFYGWLIVDFTSDGNAISDVNTISVRLTDQDLNCTDCNNGVSVELFTTADLQANPVAWNHHGTCTAPNDASNTYCDVSFWATDVEGVLLGRSIYPDSQPDPGVYVVKVLTE